MMTRCGRFAAWPELDPLRGRHRALFKNRIGRPGRDRHGLSGERESQRGIVASELWIVRRQGVLIERPEHGCHLRFWPSRT